MTRAVLQKRVAPASSGVLWKVQGHYKYFWNLTLSQNVQRPIPFLPSNTVTGRKHTDFFRQTKQTPSINTRRIHTLERTWKIFVKEGLMQQVLQELEKLIIIKKQLNCGN